MKPSSLILIGLLIGASFGVGYGFGVSVGVATCMKQAIYASSILFDVKLSPRALAIASQFPDLLRQFTIEEREKLGLNLSQIKEMEFNKVNQTMGEVAKNKYPNLYK